MSNARKVFLVSCVSEKKAGEHPAKDLYKSDLFNKSRSFVEKEGGFWYILSAEYGLVHPEHKIKTYDKTLNKMPVAERRRWAADVLIRLKKILKTDDSVIFLAGLKYREFLIGEVKKLCAEVTVPMEGLKIGKQLSWLKQRIG